MMREIVYKQKDVLVKAGWPTEAAQVFTKICHTSVTHDENKELYHLIADAFNSWCLWCEPRGVWTADKKELLSINPYDPDEING